jgi:ABC-type phosphate/phosphonate transport system substrate-binding protein
VVWLTIVSIGLGLPFGASGCNSSDGEPSVTLLRQGLHPSERFVFIGFEDEAAASRSLAPVLDALSSFTGARVKMETHTGYDVLAKRVTTRPRPEILLINSPNIAEIAEREGYVVVAANLPPYRAAIVVKQDSSVKTMDGLRTLGRPLRFALKERLSTSGFIVPVAGLDELGFEPSQVEITELGSADATLVAVTTGTHDAAGVALPHLDGFREQSTVRVIWVSDLIPGGALLLDGEYASTRGLTTDQLLEILRAAPRAEILAKQIDVTRVPPRYDVLRTIRQRSKAWLERYLRHHEAAAAGGGTADGGDGGTAAPAAADSGS